MAVPLAGSGVDVGAAVSVRVGVTAGTGVAVFSGVLTVSLDSAVAVERDALIVMGVGVGLLASPAARDAMIVIGVVVGSVGISHATNAAVKARRMTANNAGRERKSGIWEFPCSFGIVAT